MIFHDTARIQSSKPSCLILLSFQEYEDHSFTFAFTVYGWEKDYFEGRFDALNKINVKDRRFLIRFSGCLGFKLLFISLQHP